MSDVKEELKPYGPCWELSKDLKLLLRPSAQRPNEQPTTRVNTHVYRKGRPHHKDRERVSRSYTVKIQLFEGSVSTQRTAAHIEDALQIYFYKKKIGIQVRSVKVELKK